jgi:hypothetical protein
MAHAMVTKILGAALLCAAATATSGCEVSAYPDNTYDDGYPPADYIATVQPVYYEGHAAYWYGNRWYYRDAGGRWGHYDHEPAALASRRGQFSAGARVNYGRASTRGGSRGGGHR